jgi:hypothetical protein
MLCPVNVLAIFEAAPGAGRLLAVRCERPDQVAAVARVLRDRRHVATVSGQALSLAAGDQMEVRDADDVLSVTAQMFTPLGRRRCVRLRQQAGNAQALFTSL